jgi:hypothetical protein
MAFLGAVLFALIFLMLAPQTQGYLGSVQAGLFAFMSSWAPFSYLLLLILLGAFFAGMYMIKTWPQHVEPENPMAKYRRDAPVEED